MSLLSDATVVVVGHGSTKDQDAVLPTLALAACLSRLLVGLRVVPAFMRGPRGLAPVLEGLEPGSRVILLPHFSADGVFTRTLIPEVVARHAGHLRLLITPPLGMAPGVADVIATALAQAETDGGTSDLLVVAHGCAGPETGNAPLAALAETLAARGKSRRAVTVFLDHPPALSQWPDLDLGPRVVVACLFAGRGRHVRADVPAAFGLPRDTPLGTPDGLGPTVAIGGRHIRFLSPLSMPQAMAVAAKDLLENVPAMPQCTGRGIVRRLIQSQGPAVPLRIGLRPAD